jgi:23S rRNA (guanosine2251-2'-O)-methyltransferase
MIYVILNDIRSIYNVGSVFRTADAVGVDKIFLTGYTPTPHDRFGRNRKDLAKVALGAENIVLWEYKKSALALVKKLKKDGVMVIAIEQSSRSEHYKKIVIKQPVAFVYGNEVDGIDPVILKECSVVAEIPMAGKKESLNVSVSAGITLFGMLNR